MTQQRLAQIVDFAYERLREKIKGGRISVDNEASLQMQFGSILKTVGELFERSCKELFTIELEKAVLLPSGAFGKSGTKKAKIDIFCSYIDPDAGEGESCAIELKYFKKENHREPNNRYDVFADIANLERYGSIARQCFLIVGTDHSHYVSQEAYSRDTADFDFRNGVTYTAGFAAIYRTKKPYGAPIALQRSYAFHWDSVEAGLHFMKLPVWPVE